MSVKDLHHGPEDFEYDPDYDDEDEDEGYDEGPAVPVVAIAPKKRNSKADYIPVNKQKSINLKDISDGETYIPTLLLTDTDPLSALLTDGVVRIREERILETVDYVNTAPYLLPHPEDEDEIRFAPPFDDGEEDCGTLQVKLLKHQKEFVDDCDTPYLGLVAGYGSGKTDALCYKAIQLAALNAGFMKPDQYNVLLEPTGIMVRTLLMPRLERILEDTGITYTVTKSPVPSYTLYFAAGPVTIKLLSAINTDRLVGFECAFFGVDEADTVHRDTMSEAWEKLQGRMRAGVVRQGFTTSTPEGYNFLHKYFVKEAVDEDGNAKTDRRLIRGSTYDNPFLPESYIPNLLGQYPAALIQAYLHGEFVNLNNGTVYYNFDRKTHHTVKALADFPFEQVLHIGVDFNIMHMSAAVAVIDKKSVYFIDEFADVANTAALIKAIKERYPKRHIIIYPDSSGKNMSANADFSSIQLFKDAGFTMKYGSVNPRVVNRIASVNAMFKNAANDIRCRVNTNHCTRITENLEQQVYKDGKPDKSSGVDHMVDAIGYLIWGTFPIIGRPTATIG